MSTTDFRPYPLATLKMNRYGHLEINKGESDKEESDLYIQLDSDVQAILESLPKEERTEIENGWSTQTYFFNDEYFGS